MEQLNMNSSGSTIKGNNILKLDEDSENLFKKATEFIVETSQNFGEESSKTYNVNKSSGDWRKIEDIVSL